MFSTELEDCFVKGVERAMSGWADAVLPLTCAAPQDGLARHSCRHPSLVCSAECTCAWSVAPLSGALPGLQDSRTFVTLEYPPRRPVNTLYLHLTVFVGKDSFLHCSAVGALELVFAQLLEL